MNEIGLYEYSEKDCIGRGTFARVYRGHQKSESSKEVAIKVIELSPAHCSAKHILREIDLVKRLRHENIVRLLDVYQENSNSGGHILYIVMELCARDLSVVEKPLDETKCHKYFNAIFNGLRYLKKRGVVHRDIKPQNILLTKSDEVRIADFTFSKEIEEQELLQTYCGTPLYMSPEVMNGEAYTDKCDLYSVGVMLYTYVYGNHPLGNIKTQAELLSRMRQHSLSFPQRLVIESHEKSDLNGPYKGSTVLCRLVREFSPELIIFMKGLLRHNPEDRMNWDEISVDPWLKLPKWNDQELFHSNVNSPKDNVVHAFSAPQPPPVNELVKAPPLVPRTLKTVKTAGTITKSNIPMKKMVTSPSLFSGSAAALAITAENNVSTNDSEPPNTIVKTARSKPRKIKVEEQRPKSESPSPVTSYENSNQLCFQMSGDTKPETENKFGTMIILDYYNTPPEKVEDQKEEKKREEKVAPTEKKTTDSSFFSRSVDLVHKVFAL